MRRLLAVALVEAFCFPLIAPALLAGDPQSNLPACCRREGKHHCAMPAPEPGGASGAAFAGAPCLLFPSPAAIPALRSVGLANGSNAISVELAADPVARTQSETLLQISFARARQKRGPPFLPLA